MPALLFSTAAASILSLVSEHFPGIPTLKPLGDCAVRIGFGERMDPHLSLLIRAWCDCLERESIPGIVEWVPGYTALTVFYQPHLIRYAPLCEKLRALGAHANPSKVASPDFLALPVCYGGEFGPDLPFVARHAGLSEAEVIERHSRVRYLVAMIGFAPGFPYLSGMDPALAAPRLERPRLSVPQGSVGIAGEQTGVYPLPTPGGWRIIGRTPVRLFDSAREPPALLRPGDALAFTAVTAAQYGELASKVAEGSYVVRRGRMR